jgi:hypothetical protein
LERRIVLDAGCGRADFLEYVRARGINPAKYTGIEAVEELAAAAEQKHLAGATILRDDFIENPRTLDRNADVILFSGSLNTLSAHDFYQSLRIAWGYTRSELSFNFLCSPRLASAAHLTWHPKRDVVEWAFAQTSDVAVDDSYREGDCTMVLRK